MAFDSKRNKTVLFGGESRGTGLKRDTWEWDGEGWTQVEDTGPSARRASAAAFHTCEIGWCSSEGTQLDLALAILGNGTERLGLRSRTSARNPAQVPPWSSSKITPPFLVVSPPPRRRPPLSVRKYLGMGRHALDAKAGHRPRRALGHAMAFDSIRRRVVIFGGLPVFPADRDGAQDQLLGDTWEHSDNEGGGPPRLGLASWHPFPSHRTRFREAGERLPLSPLLQLPPPAWMSF